MKHIDKLKDNFLNNNFSLAILAIIIAVITWFYISLTQYPTVLKEIENIPVSFDISGTSAELNGLSVVSCDVENVTVELVASRTQVGNLNSETIEAYIDAENVSNAGTKKMSIKLKSKSGVKYDVKSVTPPSATITFDKIDTREYPIIPQIPNVSAISGKDINLEELSCEPSVVRITGPSAQLDKISKCYAVSTKSLSLDTTFVLASDEIRLYTEDKALIDQSPLKFSNSNFSIVIPVRTQKEVKLTVSISNAPNDFNKDTINFNLSTDSVTLACNNSQTVIPDTLAVGVVSLNELRPDFSKTFSLSTCLENSEFINISGIETITVTLDDDDLSQTNLIVDPSKISISNPPDSSYEYKVLTQIMTITVIGSEKSIEAINSDDIVADVNLLNVPVSTEQFTANVNFSCPNYDDVWITTNSKVMIQRIKSEPMTSYTNSTSNTQTTS